MLSQQAITAESTVTAKPSTAVLARYAILCIGVAAFWQHSSAQTAPAGRADAGQTAPTGDLTAAQLKQQGLDPTPLAIETLGLKINLPAGANTSAQKAEGRIAVSVADDQGGNTWTMRIQPLVSTLPKPTAAGQVEEHLVHLRLTKQEHTVLHNAPMTVAGVEGQLCWIELPSDKASPAISGWMILPTSDHTFMVVSAQTLAEHFSRLRPMFEACFSTIRLRSLDSLEAEKKSRLDDARAALAAATPERLRQLVGLNQWTRIYVPASASGPAIERGYSLIEVLDAKRGAITPERDEKDYSSEDHQPGLLVRLKGRVTVPNSSDVFDTIAIYWLAWDQSEEAWSIRATRRQGEASQTEAESGVRTADSPGAAPKITVVKDHSGSNVRQPYEWSVPEVYLSQALSWQLGRILPRDVTGPTEYTWYFYNFANAKPQITQRLDVWEPLRDGSGHFQLTSRFSSDTAPVVSIYGKDGMLIRRTNPDGSISEPCTIEQLQKLWKTKAPAGRSR